MDTNFWLDHIQIGSQFWLSHRHFVRTRLVHKLAGTEIAFFFFFKVTNKAFMQQVMYSVDIDTTYTKFGWKETPDVFSEFGPAKVNVTFYLRRLKSPR